MYADKSSELAKLQTVKGGGVAVYVNGIGQEKKIISLSGTNVESIGVKFVSDDIIVLTVYRPSSYNESSFPK